MEGSGTVFANTNQRRYVPKECVVEQNTINLDEIVNQLNQLPMRVYSYAALAALFGPFVLGLLGFKALGQLLRPAALLLVMGGIYAKRQKLGEQIKQRLNA